MSRMEMEQAMGAIHRAMQGKGFANAEEANAFLSTLSGKSPQEIFEAAAELTPREQAQELAFDAMEAESNAKARRLAKRALALDPVNGNLKKRALPATFYRGRDVQRLAGDNPFFDFVKSPRSAVGDEFFCLLRVSCKGCVIHFEI